MPPVRAFSNTEGDGPHDISPEAAGVMVLVTKKVPDSDFGVVLTKDIVLEYIGRDGKPLRIESPAGTLVLLTQDQEWDGVRHVAAAPGTFASKLIVQPIHAIERPLATTLSTAEPPNAPDYDSAKSDRSE